MTKNKAVEADKGIDENGLRWEEADVFGTTYRLREITVEESDVAFDAAQGPDKTFNPRLNQRLQLCSSILSPATTIDDIGKWGVAKLVMLLTAFDRLNTLPAADDEGNA
jgi:hypothetical protein